MSTTKRTFVIQASEIGFNGGAYNSDSPAKAGKKAAKRLFNLIAKDAKFKRYASKETIKFILRERTKGSEKKTYFYEASLTKLSKPKTVRVKAAPGTQGADKEGYISYEVSKEIKVQACEEFHA